MTSYILCTPRKMIGSCKNHRNKLKFSTDILVHIFLIMITTLCPILFDMSPDIYAYFYQLLYSYTVLVPYSYRTGT